jgi:hypothetical protein
MSRKLSEEPTGADADDPFQMITYHALAHLARAMGGSISFYASDLDALGKVNLVIERIEDSVPKYTFTVRNVYHRDDDA